MESLNGFSYSQCVILQKLFSIFYLLILDYYTGISRYFVSLGIPFLPAMLFMSHGLL